MGLHFTIKDFLEVAASGDASFSPDEKKIAYLSTVTGVSQIFLKSIDNGSPEQITDFSEPVSFVEFSPVDNVLLFGKAEGGNEQTQLYMLDLTTRNVTEITSKPSVKHAFGGWSPDGRSICFSSNERNGKDFDIYVMNVETLNVRCVFDGGEWCTSDGFSPQGTFLVVRQKHSNTDTDLYICNLQTGSKEHITPHTGSAFYGKTVWFQDESAFFLIQDADREFKGLARYTLEVKRFEYHFAPDWDIEDIAMDQAGNRVAVTVNENGYMRAGLYDSTTLERLDYEFPKGSVYRMNFSKKGSYLAFNLGDSRHTLDAWLLNLEKKTLRQLTQSPQGVPPDIMTEPELARFKSFDGLDVPFFIYRPTNAPAEKMSVVIDIHGGPEDQHQPMYRPIVQYLVYSGYTVVAPNIRGSSGYGKTYMGMDDREKRLDSLKDVVALRGHLSTFPYIDTKKIALYGASYGGFMVLACLAFYPKLWAAGVDIVGITNFVTFLENTSTYRRALREAEYGSIQNDREFLEKISPLQSAQNIEAPLLVIHGANDPRVPLSEAEQLVSKMRKHDKKVELVVYPDEGHGIRKLKNKLDAYPKVLEFLDKALA